MTFPTAIAFHGVDASDDLRAEVLERVKGLERFVDDILACRVEIEVDSHGPRTAGNYGVHIRLAMPCIEIEVGGRHQPSMVPGVTDGDPYVTVASTFAALNCQIEDFVRRRCKSCQRYAEMHW
jgi:ribosome-associated translation inhibitor RaiA